jgi:hypothetical protein
MFLGSLMPEDVFLMKRQERALFAVEIANIHTGVDTPLLEQVSSKIGHDQKSIVVGKRNVSLVEEVINVRGQQ